MNGFAAFLKKEYHEVVRTSRLWVLPAILLFLAVSSPIVAELTPMLVESTAESQPGVVIEIPDPTYVEAYRNYLQQLTQLMVIAVIIGSAGLISSEVGRGTAILVLTKPVSRTAFYLAKVISQTAVLFVSAVLGTAAALGVTLLLFQEGPPGDLAYAVSLWFVFAFFLLAMTALFSVGVTSQLAASGAGIGAWIVLLVVSSLGPLEDYSPAALMGLAIQAAEGRPVDPLAPLLVTAALSAGLLAAGVWLMRTKEL